MTNHIQTYYKAVCEAYGTGNIETSYNAPIMALLTEFGCKARDMSGGRGGQAGENIDIKLWRSDEDISDTEPFAGVEVKKVEGIDRRAREQIKIEAEYYGNAILTDNLVWQFWRAGEDKMYAGVQLIEKKDNKLVLKKESMELFIALIRDFLLSDPAQIRSSDKLAEYMANHAQTIRSVIAGILKDDGSGQPLVDDRQKSLPMFPELYGLYGRIKQDLRPMLTTSSFADMYAQTIVYGLFIARYNDPTPDSFDRYEAIGYLREESALLNRFFMHITSSGEMHPTLEAVIDKLCSLYRICNISELLGRDESKDTIIHFYEAFLTYYDPALRKSLGVFYTPVQAVRYLVSQVDRILIEDFGIEGGLSNNEQTTVTVPCPPYTERGKQRDTKEITVPRVAILDPATGTGSFLAEIIRYVKDTYFSGGREAFYKDYITNREGLLSRLIGFEIMMTSYAVAHLKLRRVIDETLGSIPDTQIPTNIFLTNTLAPPHSAFERDDQMSLFDFSAAITDEAYHADTWKTRRPIKVIIGNPPYLAASTNPYDISAYKTETDGVTKLNEKNPKWLGDDYVKFFRFAEEIIDKNGEGILAFVSPHGYLDNPTFRGMRASLLRTFDKIFIINLHGNSNKGETAPDGKPDENIFDIKQGIALFVGAKTTTSHEWASVKYVDLWGSRASKFDSLSTNSLNFINLLPDEKMAELVPKDSNTRTIYEYGIPVSDIMPFSTSGIVTGNDGYAYADSKQELIRRVELVKNASEKDLPDFWGRFGSGQTAERIISDTLNPEGTVTHVAFRPFDYKWTYYSGASCGWIVRPREKKIMGSLIAKTDMPIGKNIGLVFTKGDSTPNEFSMIFISNTLIDNRLTAAQTAGIASIAPLHIYDKPTDSWSPNFSPDALSRLTENMSSKPEPIEVFDYIYGILYDPVYRERFNEFLKRDFPRVPIINSGEKSSDNFYVSEEMFRAYITAGERLRKLHLMQEKVPAQLAIEPNNSDDMEIGAVKYKDGILYINANKQILGIAQNVWEYRIGGYQVLDKWLKSHKGETLTIDSFDHICNVAGLLAETIKIQESLREMHSAT